MVLHADIVLGLVGFYGEKCYSWLFNCLVIVVRIQPLSNMGEAFLKIIMLSQWALIFAVRIVSA